MRTLILLGCAAGVLLLPAALHAQTCDLMVSNPSWSVHPHPDSIYVNFYPEVISDDPADPRLYDMRIDIFVNGSLVDDWEAHLRWAHGYQCPSNCPPNVCEEKEWTYKGEIKRAQAKCRLASPTFCYCPVVSSPKQKKPIPKPTVPSLIEIEIVPLDLQGCGAVNPSNDRVGFNYPGSGPTPIAPATSPLASVILGTGLVGLAILSLRLRRRIH